MGFINTEYKNTVNSLVESRKSIINNPYYMYIDKSPTIVTYYTINKEKSTLDVGLKIVESNIGSNSPLRFNKINNFVLYGIEPMQLSLEIDEFGLSSSSVEGEAILLPNTIVPNPGDYFVITYLENRYLFKVISMNKDTLESGANIYKLGYKYESLDDKKIDNYVIEEYETIIDNNGTDYKTIIKSTDYKLITLLHEVNKKLKEYMKSVFYDKNVESLIYRLSGMKIYDPMVMEFCIRNSILKSNDFSYMRQQIRLYDTFTLDYDNNFYRCVELKNKNDLNSIIKFIEFNLICEQFSLLSMRSDMYYKVNYIHDYDEGMIDNDNIDDGFTVNSDIMYLLNNNNIISTCKIYKLMDIDTLINKIINNIYDGTIDDIIVKYFNDISINEDDITKLENLRYNNTYYLYYRLPVVVYIIEKYSKHILKDYLNNKGGI